MASKPKNSSDAFWKQQLKVNIIRYCEKCGDNPVMYERGGVTCCLNCGSPIHARRIGPKGKNLEQLY